MATRPALRTAVAGNKIKASEYNDNFTDMLNYLEDVVDDMEDYVGNFIPDVTGQNGKFLKCPDGAHVEWSTINYAEKDLTNATPTGSFATSLNSAGIRTVLGYAINGYGTWYRLWSDGWLEQGGYYTNNSNTTQTVSYLISFADTNYVLLGCCMSEVGSAIYEKELPNTPTTGGFSHTGNTNRTFRWYACGYRAS